MWESKGPFSDFQKNIQLLSSCFQHNKLRSFVAGGGGGLALFTAFEKGCDFLISLVYVFFWFCKRDEGYRSV